MRIRNLILLQACLNSTVPCVLRTETAKSRTALFRSLVRVYSTKIDLHEPNVNLDMANELSGWAYRSSYFGLDKNNEVDGLGRIRIESYSRYVTQTRPYPYVSEQVSSFHSNIYRSVNCPRDADIYLLPSYRSEG